MKTGRCSVGAWAVKESGDECIRAAQRIVARIQCDVLSRLRKDQEWDLRNSGLEEVHQHIKAIRYDADSITRQMRKLEVPQDSVSVEPGDHPAAAPAGEPPREGPVRVASEGGDEVVPKISDIMEPRDDSPGSEEDDVDVEARFLVAVNVRSGHRKLHIWGRCGRTKPGKNFSAYEPHDSLSAVKFNSLCGHCWKGKQPHEVEESSATSLSSFSSSSDTD